MQNKWKVNKFYQNLKDIRTNRAAYLSALVILLSLSVVLAITVATNRARKHGDTEAQITEGTTVQAPTAGDQATAGTPSAPSNSIPELSLPVQGKLAKAHSSDVQVFSQTMQDFRVHLGIDIATAPNAEVFAVADGTVKRIWTDPMMGQCIAIEHSGDCITVYKNLSPETATGLAAGSSVKQGQLIGTVGESALLELADEPHLHMEMTVKGLQVDPLEYFSAAVVAALSEDTAFETPVSGGK